MSCRSIRNRNRSNFCDNIIYVPSRNGGGSGIGATGPIGPTGPDGQPGIVLGSNNIPTSMQYNIYNTVGDQTVPFGLTGSGGNTGPGSYILNLPLITGNTDIGPMSFVQYLSTTPILFAPLGWIAPIDMYVTDMIVDMSFALTFDEYPIPPIVYGDPSPGVTLGLDIITTMYVYRIQTSSIETGLVLYSSDLEKNLTLEKYFGSVSGLVPLNQGDRVIITTTIRNNTNSLINIAFPLQLNVNFSFN